KVTGTHGGAGNKQEVPDVPKYDSESKEESWTFSQGDDDTDDESDMNDDSEATESDDDGDDLTYPNLSTVYTSPDYQPTDEEENQENVDKVKEGEEEKEEEECNNKALLPQQTWFSVAAETPSSTTTIPQPPILNLQPLQQTPDPTTTTIPTTTSPYIPTFASVFQFDQRVSALETELSALKQTNQFTADVSLIFGIIDQYLASKAIIKEQVQEQVSMIMPQIEKYVADSLGAEVMVRSTNQPQTSYAVAASLLEFELKKILIDKMETNKSIARPDIQKDLYKALVESYNSDKDIISTYGDVVTLKRGRDDQDKDEDPFAGSNLWSNKRRLGKEAELSKEPTHKESKSTSSSKGASRSQPKSSGKTVYAEEREQKVDDLEDQAHQEFNTGNDNDVSQWNPSSSPTPDREWHQTKTVDNRLPQPCCM
ncbi:hypothetical protein Tco_1233850, partial [Tanacetum coccineum]